VGKKKRNKKQRTILEKTGEDGGLFAQGKTLRKKKGKARLGGRLDASAQKNETKLGEKKRRYGMATNGKFIKAKALEGKDVRYAVI